MFSAQSPPLHLSESDHRAEHPPYRSVLADDSEVVYQLDQQRSEFHLNPAVQL